MDPFTWKSPGRAMELAKELAKTCKETLGSLVDSVSVVELKENVLYRALTLNGYITLSNGLYTNILAMSIRNRKSSFIGFEGVFKGRELKVPEAQIVYVDTFLWTKWKFRVSPKDARKSPLILFMREHEESLKREYFKQDLGEGKIHYFRVYLSEDSKFRRVNVRINIWMKNGLIRRNAIDLILRTIGLLETYFMKKISQKKPPEPLKTFNIKSL
mgnify:CR=1 FL=1